MKNITTLLITLFTSLNSINIHAQLNKTKVKIILTNGNELNGFAKRHKNEVYLYKSRKSKEKKIIAVPDIKSLAYVFKEGYREFHYLKKEGTNKYRLLLPLIKGDIMLYKSFSRENMGKINNNADISYVVSKDGVNYHLFKNFKKEARKYFGDCNLIVDGINSREFSRLDLAEMVVIYNDGCIEVPKDKIALKELDPSNPIIIKTSKSIAKILFKLKNNPEVKVLKNKVLVNTNTIYFNLNNAELTENSLQELEKIVRLMQKYPNIKIQAESHTDSRGNTDYNLKLSQLRAESVVNYITNKGVDKARINAIGYGETRPINNCNEKCTELEHEQNRRTEFIIINPETIK